MIRLRHLYKTYPGPYHALKNVSLSIDRGEFIFLIGPSGAGKTTLFRLLSAFDRPSSGEIEFGPIALDRITAKEVPAFRRQIGVVYQDFRLLTDRTVAENVALPLEVRCARPAEVDSRVNAILDQVGLGYKKRNYPEQLSGGEQQRVAIARALIHQPSLLIADEPTGNLDPQLANEIMDLLDKVNAQGTTVFVATHDHDLVRRKNKRVVEIKAGEIIRSA